jgi:hypothetical protein
MRILGTANISPVAIVATVGGIAAASAIAVGAKAILSGSGNVVMLMDGGVTTNQSTVIWGDRFGDAQGVDVAASNTQNGGTQDIGTTNTGSDCTTLTCIDDNGAASACCVGMSLRSWSGSGSCVGTNQGIARGVKGSETCSTGVGSCAIAAGQPGACTGTCSIAGPQWVKASGNTLALATIPAFGVAFVTVASNGQALGSGTFNVNVGSTTNGFSTSSTTLDIRGKGRLSCSGKTNNSFTNCTGGTPGMSLATGDAIEDDAIRPLHVKAHGNAVKVNSNSSDLRFFAQANCQHGSPADLRGCCDFSSPDNNGDGKLKCTLYVAATTWNTAGHTSDTSTFNSCHLIEGSETTAACGDNKIWEWIQFEGDDNGGDKYAGAVTCGTHVCPNGSLSASTWYTGTKLSPTAHRTVYRLKIKSTPANCSGPDSKGVTPTCKAGVNHNELEVRVDQPDESGTADIPNVVIEGFEPNGILCGGNNSFPEAIEEFNVALTYDDAVNDRY